MKYHTFDFEGESDTARRSSFRNKLNNKYGTCKISRADTAEQLSRSLKYFNCRLSDYHKAVFGASYFLKQVKSGSADFDSVSQLYWTQAFDPCSKHAKDIFLSLDPVYESLRDKLSSLELGE